MAVATSKQRTRKQPSACLAETQTKLLSRFISIFFLRIHVRREGYLAAIVAVAKRQANYIFPVVPRNGFEEAECPSASLQKSEFGAAQTMNLHVWCLFHIHVMNYR